MWQRNKGQSGGIATFFIIIVVFAFVYIFLGVLMDKCAEISKTLMIDYPFTQEHVDATNFMFDVWYVLPVIIIIFLLFYLIHNALRSRAGET